MMRHVGRFSEGATRSLKFVAVLLVLAMLAAACGADTQELPPDANPDETPGASSACLVGEPNCNDTMAPGEEPTNLPPAGEDEPNTSGGLVVDGGLSISDALTTDATGVIAVGGFLVVDESGAKLCELLAESLPPQCGGASLPISNYEEALSVPIQNAQGVTWTDARATFLGEIIDGALVVNANAS